jgi:hypothetical protein
MKKLKTKPYTQRSRTKRALLCSSTHFVWQKKCRAINDALELIYTCFSIALVKNKAAKLTLLTLWRRLRGMCVVGHEASEGESKSFRKVRTSGDCCLVAVMSGLKTMGVGWIWVRGRWGSLRSDGNGGRCAFGLSGSGSDSFSLHLLLPSGDKVPRQAMHPIAVPLIEGSCAKLPSQQPCIVRADVEQPEEKRQPVTARTKRTCKPKP